MELTEILLKKSEIAIHDVLILASHQGFLSEFSTKKHPHFFDNQKNIDSYYRRGLNTVYESVQLNQISAFGRLLSTSSGDYASIKNIHKLINKNDLHIKNTETKKSFEEMVKIFDGLSTKNNEIVKKIVGARNNLVAHSFNEECFKQEGGGSKPSENQKIIDQMLVWSIRLSMLIMSLNLKSNWNHLTISTYVLQTIPMLHSKTVKHFLAFDEGNGMSPKAIQHKLIPIE